jgi:tetratricopeptide (TPR) repeat protein
VPAPTLSAEAARALDWAAVLEGDARRLVDAHKNGEALKPAETALELRRTHLGPAHADTLRAAELVASIALHHRGDAARAEKLLSEDVAAREAAVGTQHVSLAAPLEQLAEAVRWLHDLSRAEALRRRALAIREATVGPSHPEVANALVGLADLLDAACRYQEARALAARALAILESARGPTHPDLDRALGELAWASYLAGDDAAAEAYRRRAVEILAPREAAEPTRLTRALGALARHHERTGDFKAARTVRERVLAVVEARLGADDPARRDAAVALARDDHALHDDPAVAALSAKFGFQIRMRDPPQRSPTPRCTVPTATTGSVANAAAVVASLNPAFRSCYNAALQQAPSASGRALAVMTLGASGAVETVAVWSMSRALPKGMLACVADHAFAATFAPPEGGSATIVAPVSFVTQ